MSGQQPMTRPSRRRVILGAGGTVAAMVVTACSSSKKAPTAPTPTASPSASATASQSASASALASATSASTGAAAITIKNFTFTPNTLTVPPGARITVTNQDSIDHTLTATSANAFDTGMLAGGKSAVITAPSKPGDYPFSCTIHPFMKGTLTVR